MIGFILKRKCKYTCAFPGKALFQTDPENRTWDQILFNFWMYDSIQYPSFAQDRDIISIVWGCITPLLYFIQGEREITQCMPFFSRKEGNKKERVEDEKLLQCCVKPQRNYDIKKNAPLHRRPTTIWCIPPPPFSCKWK